LLLLAPFPPRLDASDGGNRSVASLSRALARRNRIALAYLRTPDPSEIDPAVAECRESLLEGQRPGTSRSSVRPWHRALAVAPQFLAGKPLWVAARWSAPFAARTASLAAAWKPHVVQAETGAMDQYLVHVSASRARTI